MPLGEVFFKLPDDTVWTDIYETYGISFTEKALSALMTPAPNKDAIENRSRLQNGKRVTRKAKYAMKDERNVDMEMHLYAPDSTAFWRRYDKFCDDWLDKGFFDIKNSHVPNKVFRMTYLSCNQFSEYMEQLAKFTLRLNEPDPSNRGATDSWVETQQNNTE